MGLEISYKVELRIRAKEEVDEISYYYENLSVGLGKRFYKEFKELSLSLKINPYFQIFMVTFDVYLSKIFHILYISELMKLKKLSLWKLL